MDEKIKKLPPDVFYYIMRFFWPKELELIYAAVKEPFPLYMLTGDEDFRTFPEGKLLELCRRVDLDIWPAVEGLAEDCSEVSIKKAETKVRFCNMEVYDFGRYTRDPIFSNLPALLNRLEEAEINLDKARRHLDKLRRYQPLAQALLLGLNKT